MSVIIKEMEMPRGCNACQLCDLYSGYYICRAKKMERRGVYLIVTDEAISGIRHSYCPLVEIPTPHGRLIDADRLMEVIEKNSYLLKGYYNSLENGMFLTGIKQAINEAPTIIEAEVE